MPALIAGVIGTAGLATSGAIPGYAPVAAQTEVTVSYDDAVLAAENAAARLREAAAYTATVTGKTVAKKGFINYEQKIANTIIGRGGEYYARSESSSLFVKVRHEAYLRSGKVAYRDDGGNIKAASVAEYAGVYGVIPGGGIDGHLISSDTIVAARYDGEDNGLHVYRYEIDGERGSYALKKQMKEFGGLKDLPEFVAHSRLTLTLREDHTPVSLVTEERYTIAIGILGNLNCTQSLTCSFGYDPAPVPDEAAFAAAIG